MQDCRIPEIDYGDFGASVQQKAQAKGRPIKGQWEITFRCNLKCAHCYVVEDENKQELTLLEITNILDQIHQEGCLWLCLTGGEPLLREDFLDIYTYAIKKGFLVTLFTNGTLITPEIANCLKLYPPFMVEITLNGITSETYEKITRTPGSFQACLRGIKLILERNIPLTLKSVGMTLNRDEILKIKKYAQSLKKVRYRYDPIIVPRLDSIWGPCQFRLSPEEIMDIEYNDSDMRREWRDYLRCEHMACESDALFRCTGGINSFNISPYGELQLCQLLRQPSFNLRQGSFRQGFYNLFPKIRLAKYEANSKCKGCKISYLCHQCPARAQLENGHPEIAVDYYCELAHRRQETKGVLIDQDRRF
jgi:radical SAM protein with 4Fe4S-binding SPASM domain